MRWIDFQDQQPLLRCKQCSKTAIVITELDVAPHYAKAFCVDCGTFFDWIRAPENDAQRLRLPRGTKDAIWGEWDGRCVACNMHAVDLARLGIARTVQHTPPYRDAAHSGRLLPFCDECQQDATRAQRRHERFLRKLDRADA